MLTFRYATGKAKPYYSGKEKSFLRMLKDLYLWQLREGDFNFMYYAFALNLAGSRQDEFIGGRSFLKIKERVEAKLRDRAGCSDVRYDAITKDKFYANSIFSANGIVCLRNLAFIHGTEMVYTDGHREKVDVLLDLHGTFIVKNTVLEAGEGVFRCRSVDKKIEANGKLQTLDSFIQMLGNRIWVLQGQYLSHQRIRKINASALNTTRIVTILHSLEPEYLGGFQGFATGNAFTDSWSHGSIYAGIDPLTGFLKEYAITAVEDERPGLLREHPDSKVVFKDYEIPFLKEAVDLCLRAHRLLYFSFVIGWDVAITDEGPMIVEANEKPGMSAVQCLDGGLRKKIEIYAADFL
ncbi:MAG: hypothetical protein MUD09_08505 [Desulfobacterales bacterium]|nr:hypothetical protein [Desulfobacterales bacterium]